MNIRFIISLLAIIFSFSIHATSVYSAGNPYITSHGVNFASGNKYHKETDISIDGPVFPLTFTRHYNSQSTVNGDLGYGWSHSYSEKLAITSSKIKHTRPDGRVVTYNYNSGEGVWIKENGKYAKITKISTEYHLFQNGYTTHIFDSDDDITGKIIQRLDRSGIMKRMFIFFFPMEGVIELGKIDYKDVFMPL